MSNCCCCFLRAWLRARSRASRGSSRVALDVLHAVAIEIPLACPMRMNNLAALAIERHFKWRGVGNHQTLSLYVPAGETKNGVAIEADFHRDTTTIIRLHLKSHRALVSTAPEDWLFPLATGGGHRGPDHLSQELKDAIWRETGLEMNGHLFRHLAGKLFLERRPGRHETVRQFLRHKKSDTTTTFYTGLDSKRASQHYYEVVLADRRQTGRKS
jgi:integrase